MENSLILIKPSAVQRELIGEIISFFERKGLQLIGLKMIQLDNEILDIHYSHLKTKSFFNQIKLSMMATPIIVCCFKGVNCVEVIRNLTGATNGQKAAPGTIRGIYSVSGQENIIHSSDSVENAAIEIKRFFKDEELFNYEKINIQYIYATDEL